MTYYEQEDTQPIKIITPGVLDVTSGPAELQFIPYDRVADLVTHTVPESSPRIFERTQVIVTGLPVYDAGLDFSIGYSRDFEVVAHLRSGNDYTNAIIDRDTNAITDRDIQPSWISDCKSELDSIHETAQEENLDPPANSTVSAARKILEHLAKYGDEIEPVVYPTDAGVVSIYMTQTGSFVLVNCEPSGKAVCFATINGKRARCRFDEGPELLEVFLDSQVRKLINVALAIT